MTNSVRGDSISLQVLEVRNIKHRVIGVFYTLVLSW